MTNQITEVRLLAVPLENDYKHTVYFSNEATQYLSMSQKVKHTFTNFSYQRKDKYIAIPKHYDDLQDCNYVMYNNTGENGANWVYAFITRMEYKNDNVTWVYIETDVIQTYMFKYSVKPSFIEREHVTDDTIGLHTVPENLEMGEYICTFNGNIPDLQSTRIVVGVTEHPDGTNFTGGRYNNMYSGVKYYAFETLAELQSFIDHYRDGDSTDEAIVCMFMAPELLTNRYNIPDVSGWTNNRKMEVLESSTTLLPTYSSGITKNVLQDGLHTIRNNKLYCYPYKYFTVSNNNGASAIYQYELFTAEGVALPFEIHGVLTPGCSIRLIPQNYKGVLSNEEEGLNLGKYPILNWTSDVYTNWLTQNGVNIAVNMVTGLGQIIAGGVLAAGTGGAGIAVGGGQIASGATQIASQLGQIHQMSFTPPQAQGNLNCGDVIAAKAQNTFTFYGMSIKAEYLAIIDDYFDMFGYKCNLVKVPNSNHRETWWYTKTIDVNIDGNIRNDDLQKIKNVYNNGITFWRSLASIGDYSLSNSIK